LAGSSSNSEGRLEVKYNGTWGTVCKDRFETVDTTVVCNSLRFGLVAWASNYYNVTCRPNEKWGEWSNRLEQFVCPLVIEKYKYTAKIPSAVIR